MHFALSKKQLSALIILTNVVAVQGITASGFSFVAKHWSVLRAMRSCFTVYCWKCTARGVDLCDKIVWWEDTVFWYLTSCCLVEICLLFGKTHCFHRTAEMETPRCSETSGVLYQTTRRHIDSFSHSVGRGVWTGLRWSGGGLSSWRQWTNGREFLESLSSCWLPAGQGRGSPPAALLQQDVYGTVVIICATWYNTKKRVILPRSAFYAANASQYSRLVCIRWRY